MTVKYRHHNLLFLLTIFSLVSCGSNSDIKRIPSEEELHAPQESESFSWMLANHSEKIAHYDKSRSILQIRVLDQSIHGARQCGYHSVRNFFYLAALSEAIQHRDSALINKLSDELHNVTYFNLFVEELAKQLDRLRRYLLYVNFA